MPETVLTTYPHVNRIYTDEHGEQLVEMAFREYEELMEELEELRDIVVINDRCNDPTIPWEEMKKRLKKNGCL